MTPLTGSQLQLIKENHNIAFNCGDGDLNEFFCNDAVEYQKQLLAKTYQYAKNNEIIAMFSVSNDNISLSSETKKRTYQRSKQLRYYPAVKIGRLGVAESQRDKGIGSQIIQFLKIFFLVRNKTGCRYITVDAYNKPRTLNFYKTNGFDFFTKEDESKETRTMYLDLLPFHKTIQANKDLRDKIDTTIKDVLKES